MAKQQKYHQRNKRHAKRILPVDPKAFYDAVLQAVEVRTCSRIQEHADCALLGTDDKQFLNAFNDSYPQMWDSVWAYMRLEALVRLVREHDFCPLVTPIENGLQIANTLFYVAATAPIDEKGSFQPESFREAVAVWVKEHPDRGKEMTD